MKVIGIYSSKGGVGKTACAVNLAWTFSSRGRATLLWDLDPQGAASFYLNDEEGLDSSVKKLFSGKRDWGDQITRSPYPGLDLIPGEATLRNWDVLLEEEKKPKKVLVEWLKPLRERYDRIVLDCPPGMGLIAENIFRSADTLLVPVVPSPLSLRSLRGIRDFFAAEELPAEKIRFFVSMADTRKRLHRDTIEALFADPSAIPVTVPYLSEIEKMGTLRRPSAVPPKSRSRKVFCELADLLEEA